jgi:predicted HTH domain antitoxin
METKTIRLKRDRVKEMEGIAEEEDKKVSEVLRDIIERGLKEYKIERAIKKYLAGSLSQGAAAEEAGLLLQEFHQELKKRGFILRIDERQVEAELEEL